MEDYSNLTVRLKGDATSFKQAMGHVKDETDKTHSKLKGFSSGMASLGSGMVNIGKVAAKALAVAGAAIAGAGMLMVKAFTDSQDVQAQLQAVLKSTHMAAGLYIQDLNDQAQALQKVTRFDDEAIGKAQALLLTFTSIHGEMYQRTIPVILDMATAMGTDLQAATIQIGKALQDPIKGITALRRVGVNFNAQQTEQIKKMVESGNVIGAQNRILRELQTEFGGSAEAAGGTFAGSLVRLKNAIGDIQETIGELIVQYLTPIIIKIAEFVQRVDWQAVMQRSARAVKEVAGALRDGIVWIINLGQSIAAYFAPGVERLIGIVRTLAGIFMTNLWPSIMSIYNSFKDRLLPQIKALWTTIEPGFTMALKVVGVILGVGLVAAIKIFLVALNVVISTLSFGIRVIRNLIGWVGNIGGVFINVFRGIPNAIGKAWNGLVGILTWPFKTAFNGIARMWNNTIGKLSFKIPSWVPGLGGKGFDVPDIPLLAAGGIVKSPTLAMLAEAGHPEAVVPLDNRGNMAPSIGSNTFIFNPVFKIGMYAGMPSEKREIAVSLWRELVREARAHNVQLPQIGAVSPQ